MDPIIEGVGNLLQHDDGVVKIVAFFEVVHAHGGVVKRGAGVDCP